MQKNSRMSWPDLPYKDFAETAYFLHMALQMPGKLKLLTPFEPQWANVALWVTTRGLTTGPIPYNGGIFSVDADFIDHKIICTNSWGGIADFALESMSVADFKQKLFKSLADIGIDVSINPIPQEVPNPIPFDKDITIRNYDKKLANAWWQILVSTYIVMQKYHGRYNGKTPPIGFMWGTFDLRDARYHGVNIPTTGLNAEYIRRNAMNEDHVEIGWWCGNEAYPEAAYFFYIYPAPDGIDKILVKPDKARWDEKMGVFILDYKDVRQSNNPEEDLLLFFESGYNESAKLANWDPKLIGSGKPI